MKKQTVILSGVSSAIGKEIARHFLENGDNVVLNSPSAEELTYVFNQLGGGANLAMVPGKASNRVTGIKILAMAVGKFGSADVLVNISDDFEPRPFFKVDEAYLDGYLDINFKGTFFTTQAIIQQMLKQRDGVVINIGSNLLSHAHGAAQTALMATNGTLHALTAHLAAEFGKNNIRFHTMLPGTRTDSPGEATDFAQMVYTVAKSSFITSTIITSQLAG